MGDFNARVVRESSDLCNGVIRPYGVDEMYANGLHL